MKLVLFVLGLIVVSSSHAWEAFPYLDEWGGENGGQGVRSINSSLSGARGHTCRLYIKANRRGGSIRCTYLNLVDRDRNARFSHVYRVRARIGDQERTFKGSMPGHGYDYLVLGRAFADFVFEGAEKDFTHVSVILPYYGGRKRLIFPFRGFKSAMANAKS